MPKVIIAMIYITGFLACETVVAGKPGGSAYLDGKSSQSAVILLHGKDKHPKWKVVNPLRKAIHKKHGYHTLSLQMPTVGKKFKDYASVFPEANKKIQEGISYLKEEKSVTRIYILGHSMGSRMASYFIAGHPDAELVGLIVIGCRNNGGHPLSCGGNLQTVRIPVLDIWGGKDGKDTDAANDRVGLVSDKYSQVEISAANHKFEGEEKKLSAAVVDWLATQ